ncbi:MAG: archease, partial [Nanoarchaeota archaeon]
MKKYKFFDHTADVMFEAYGKTLNELFENAALATQETQVDLKDVKGKIKRKINLKNKSIEMLLFDFLQELIFLKDSQYSLFSKFKI